MSDTDKKRISLGDERASMQRGSDMDAAFEPIRQARKDFDRVVRKEGVTGTEIKKAVYDAKNTALSVVKEFLSVYHAELSSNYLYMLKNAYEAYIGYCAMIDDALSGMTKSQRDASQAENVTAVSFGNAATSGDRAELQEEIRDITRQVLQRRDEVKSSLEMFSAELDDMVFQASPFKNILNKPKQP